MRKRAFSQAMFRGTAYTNVEIYWPLQLAPPMDRLRVRLVAAVPWHVAAREAQVVEVHVTMKNPELEV